MAYRLPEFVLDYGKLYPLNDLPKGLSLAEVGSERRTIGDIVLCFPTEKETDPYFWYGVYGFGDGVGAHEYAAMSARKRRDMTLAYIEGQSKPRAEGDMKKIFQWLERAQSNTEVIDPVVETRAWKPHQAVVVKQPQPQSTDPILPRLARILGIAPDAPEEVVLGEVEHAVKRNGEADGKVQALLEKYRLDAEQARCRADRFADRCGELDHQLSIARATVDRLELQLFRQQGK